MSGPTGRGYLEVPPYISFGRLVDSATFVADVEDAWDPSWGLVVGQLYSARTGSGDTATVNTRASRETRSWLAARVLDLRSARPLPDQRVRLVLGDSAGPAPRTVADFLTCAPEIVDREVASTWLRAIGRQLARVAEASRSSYLDGTALSLARSLSYRPATIEGIPVPVWVSIPITLR